MVGEIYRLAWQYRQDVRLKMFQTPYQVFDYVRSLSYVPDSRYGYTELFKRSEATDEQGGDCDDKTIFAGSAFYLLNIPWRVKTISTRPDGEFNHVYTEIFFDGRWIPFDATYLQNTFGMEPRSTARIIWDNPMNYQRGQYGLVTLEGGGVSLQGSTTQDWTNYFKTITDSQTGALRGQNFDAVVKNGLGVASTAAGTSIATTVGAASLAVPIAAVAAGLVGIFLAIFKLKGPTPHMTAPDAGAVASNIIGGFVNAVKAMPVDAQNYAIGICNNFQTKMAGYIGDGWIAMDNDGPDRSAFMGSTYQQGVGYLKRYYNGHSNNGDLTGKNGWVAQMTAQLFGPAYVVARSIDASDQAHWTNEFSLYFANYYQSIVLIPMQSYLGTQFTALVNQLHAAVATNPTQPVTQTQTVTNTPAATPAAGDNSGLLIAAGIAAIFLN